MNESSSLCDTNNELVDKLCLVKMELAQYKEDKEDFELQKENLMKRIKRMEETMAFKDKEIMNMK